MVLRPWILHGLSTGDGTMDPSLINNGTMAPSRDLHSSTYPPWTHDGTIDKSRALNGTMKHSWTFDAVRTMDPSWTHDGTMDITGPPWYHGFIRIHHDKARIFET